MTQEKEITHVVGTFLIKAEGAFLNGAGTAKGEYGNTVEVKRFADLNGMIPYVSAQAWKRWLRNTFQEEYPDLPHAEIEAIDQNEKGNTNKIGTKMDPVEFPEDDVFGYMRAERGQGKVAEEGGSEGEEVEDVQSVKNVKREKTKAVMRTSPFHASLLISLRKSSWKGLDKAYVHLKEGTPQPYNTEFYNTQLQGIFALNYARLGVFRNEGDRIELDEKLLKKYLDDKKIKEICGNRKIYAMENNPRKERTSAILRSLAIMRGGAKQAQFATDIAPKAIVVAGLNCGNPIFNDLFEDTKNGPVLKKEVLEQIIKDYANRIVTSVYIGVRTGYLSNEKELKEWIAAGNPSKITVVLSTPKEAIESLVGNLK
ncbi:MAG: type I-B CRISPR-associated protein Cas7/Cst2/DevR [Nanoarchaeota archaeon]